MGGLWGDPPPHTLTPFPPPHRWGRLPGGVRARVLRGGAKALEGGATERLRAELRRWAARVELGGGDVKVGGAWRRTGTNRRGGDVGGA